MLGIVLNIQNNVKRTAQYIIDIFDERSKILNNQPRTMTIYTIYFLSSVQLVQLQITNNLFIQLYTISRSIVKSSIVLQCHPTKSQVSISSTVGVIDMSPIEKSSSESYMQGASYKNRDCGFLYVLFYISGPIHFFLHNVLIKLMSFQLF